MKMLDQLRIKNQNSPQQCIPPAIRDKARRKIGGSMNSVHRIRRSNGNLRVPGVRWAYKTIIKRRGVKVILSMVRRDGTKKTDGIWLLQEAIRSGSRRLPEIDEEWARLRRKSVMLDEEIRKMKVGIAQPGRVNLQIRKPGLARSTSVLERAATLLSWLRLHQWRGVPYTTEHDRRKDTKAIETCP